MIMNHPIQPLQLDSRGVLRFKPNAIVQYLLDRGPFDMNHLAMQGFSDPDREQFAQLIGYSHDGFGTLSYATDRVYDKAADRYNARELRKAEAASAAAELAIEEKDRTEDSGNE